MFKMKSMAKIRLYLPHWLAEMNHQLFSALNNPIIPRLHLHVHAFSLNPLITKIYFTRSRNLIDVVIIACRIYFVKKRSSCFKS